MTEEQRTSGPSIEKVIERVRKMWAHAESAKDIGSLAEAEAFAEAVQKTLAAYKLDMSVLSVQQKDANDPLGSNNVSPVEGWKQKRVWWIEELAGVVARAHYCQILIYRGSATVCVVGRQSDREVASYMIVVLTRLAQELCQQGYWKARYVAFKETGTYDTGDFKESFFRGFVEGIRNRYYELKEAQRKSSNGMALVLVRSQEEVQKFLTEEMGVKTGKASGLRRGSASNALGYNADRNAAKAANLGGKAATAGAQNKAISKPTSQLGSGK